MPRRGEEKNTGNYATVNGDRGPASFNFDIDEAPQAVFKESETVTTRPIPDSDNRGAGASTGNQVDSYGPQGIKLKDGSNVDFYATPVANPRRINGTNGDDPDLTGSFGKNNFIYGLNGNDTLSAARTTENSGDNALFGGPGNDVLYGGSGKDILLGQNDNDQLYGDTNNDKLYGGKGDDLISGGLGADEHWFAPGEGTDTVLAYNRGDGDVLRFRAGLDGRQFNYDNLSTMAYTERFEAGGMNMGISGTKLLYNDEVLAKFPLVSPNELDITAPIYT